jgi:hypothetical protein
MRSKNRGINDRMTHGMQHLHMASSYAAPRIQQYISNYIYMHSCIARPRPHVPLRDYSF